jgi:hypothetical protein
MMLVHIIGKLAKTRRAEMSVRPIGAIKCNGPDTFCIFYSEFDWILTRGLSGSDIHFLPFLVTRSPLAADSSRLSV